jgi:uncharacterized protein YdbL (DUF1318 family)
MWKNFAQVSALAATDHYQTSTIVCVNHVKTKGLSGESLDGYYETGITLSSSNFENTITNSWP